MQDTIIHRSASFSSIFSRRLLCSSMRLLCSLCSTTKEVRISLISGRAEVSLLISINNSFSLSSFLPISISSSASTLENGYGRSISKGNSCCLPSIFHLFLLCMISLSLSGITSIVDPSTIPYIFAISAGIVTLFR